MFDEFDEEYTEGERNCRACMGPCGVCRDQNFTVGNRVQIYTGQLGTITYHNPRRARTHLGYGWWVYLDAGSGYYFAADELTKVEGNKK